MPRPDVRPPLLRRRRLLGSATALAGLLVVGAAGCDAGDAPAPRAR
ncbi:hypothetical protein [Nocardioides sambongensis]|nr:hypothetical protein [Nocardioides sambongensis]